MNRDIYEKYKINPNINKFSDIVDVTECYYYEIIELQAKLNKLMYLEMVKSDNVALKKGLLNTVMLEAERIKDTYFNENGMCKK